MARYRHELKFVISLAEAEEIFADSLQYCDWDPYVDKTHSYEVASVYYDTDDLRFYQDREESIGYRRKLRLRSYNQAGKCLSLFIEIKEKHQQFVLKKRLNLKSDEILSLHDRHDQIPLDELLAQVEGDDAEIRELRYLQDRLRLQPIILIRYHRKPLIPKYEHDMRITLDTRITAGGSILTRYDENEEIPIIDPDKGVFEVKTNKAIPMWLQSILKRHRLAQVRYSKYCLGVDAKKV